MHYLTVTMTKDSDGESGTGDGEKLEESVFCDNRDSVR